jgi:hypothetical protein
VKRFPWGSVATNIPTAAETISIWISNARHETPRSREAASAAMIQRRATWPSAHGTSPVMSERRREMGGTTAFNFNETQECVACRGHLVNGTVQLPTVKDVRTRGRVRRNCAPSAPVLVRIE